jgi:hypothetical protein
VSDYEGWEAHDLLGRVRELERELAEARKLAADVLTRWSGRIDYYGYAVLDSDVAIRLHKFKAEAAPAEDWLCSQPDCGKLHSEHVAAQQKQQSRNSPPPNPSKSTT